MEVQIRATPAVATVYIWPFHTGRSNSGPAVANNSLLPCEYMGLSVRTDAGSQERSSRIATSANEVGTYLTPADAPGPYPVVGKLTQRHRHDPGHRRRQRASLRAGIGGIKHTADYRRTSNGYAQTKHHASPPSIGTTLYYTRSRRMLGAERLPASTRLGAYHEV